MKHLKIKTWETQWGWLLQIKEQTHRCHDFGSHGDGFLSSDKFILKSVSHPDRMTDVSTLRGYTGGLYVRGYGCEDDAIIYLFEVPNVEKWLKKLDKAVKEYNEAFKN